MYPQNLPYIHNQILLFYHGIWDVPIGETNISRQRVCKLLCVISQFPWLWPVPISLFALQGAVQVCKEWSHSGGPKGETNRLLVAWAVAVMCMWCDFTKKLVTWYRWVCFTYCLSQLCPNFHGCPLSLHNPSCPLFPLPSHPTPLPFPSPLFPLPSHPHTSPTPFFSCLLTSVMIYHRGASLSEQHNEFLICLICHCTKQGLSRTSRYVNKSSPEIARYLIRMPTARAQLLSVWLHMHKLSFTLKSLTEFLMFISAVYAWPLPGATSITVMIETCTACGQPAVDDL